MREYSALAMFGVSVLLSSFVPLVVPSSGVGQAMLRRMPNRERSR